jgi:hypothetical protein
MKGVTVEKDEFVKTVASRLNADPRHVSATVDATLAELIAPSIFGTGKKPGGVFADNNCGNGCGGAEAIRATPVQPG